MPVEGNIGGGDRERKRERPRASATRPPVRPLSTWGSWLLQNPVADGEEPGEELDDDVAESHARRPYRKQVIERG